MLVLTMKSNDKIMIGDEIEIVCTKVGGGQVKLGFVAPPDVKIHRLKVWRRIRAQQELERRKAGGEAA